MGSVHSGTVPKAHANTFDSEGRVVDYADTSLHQAHGAWQEDHNQSGQFGYSNQDLLGAEAIGNSSKTPGNTLT